MAQPPFQSKPPTFDDAKLTPEHRARFENWINEKTALIGKCPICSSRKWGVLDHFIHTPLFYPNGSMVLGGGPTYPFVGLICNECGNTQFINAVASGVVDNGAKPNKPD